MRKTLRSMEAMILTAGVAISLAACGNGPAGDTDAQGGAYGGAEGIAIEAHGTEGGDGTAGGDAGAADGSGALGGAGGLRLLCAENDEGCHTEDGYYYIEKEGGELSDGSYGYHLMYMDFETLQEIYLCSDTGCSHNSPDCPAVLSGEEFMPYTTLLFPYQGSLYLFSKAQDHDGSMQTDYSAEGETLGRVEGEPSVLYRANLDGTDREKVYSFDASLTVEDYVIGDENGLYLVTKKLTSEQDGLDTYVHSEQRKLVYLDLGKRETREVASMDFEGDISWKVVGCYKRNLVLEGLDYGREVSSQELFDDDINKYRELYQNSQEVFATLNLDSGELTERYRVSNREQNSFLVSGNSLYCSMTEGGSVKEIDLETGGQRNIYSEPGRYYYLFCMMGDKLCCMNHSGDDWDHTYYYIDKNTGEMSHSPLVNKTLGWSLEFKAVLESDVLVVYDYEATSFGDGSYEITLYQHGLISQSDLFAGNDNFRKINMIGKGW